MDPLLDNIVWHALAGDQRHLSQGGDRGRRYQRGVTDLIGFPEPEAPDFDALGPWCEPGERFYCLGWTGAVPAGWAVEREAPLLRMLWGGGPLPAPPAHAPVRLHRPHVAPARALAERTQPGPFGARSFELGEYVGIVEDGALVAMAGERMAAGRLREISAVCTEPQAQGRGLARGLVAHLLQRQLARGEQPFLHVMAHNTVAHRLYERMGFRLAAETVARIVSRR